jgi:autotransporter-associated beta strand protein
MKSTRFNRFVGLAALAILPGSLFAADITRNDTANELVSDEAWIDTVAPSASDRAVWNSASVGGATTLGGDASWQGILISGGTPSSGPLFTNAVNPNSHTLSLGAGGINLNNGGNTNRGITFDSNTKLDLTANQTWILGLSEAAPSSANIVVGSVISGTGALEVTRAATSNNYVQLSGANTFSGGLNVGSNAWLRVASSSVTSLTTVTSGSVGTGNLTLNDRSILSSATGDSRLIAALQINLLGNATLNQNTGATGRLQIAGTWDLGGGNRTLSIEKTSSALGSGNEGLGFQTPTGFSAPKVQNGALTLSTVSGTVLNKALVRFTTTTFENNAALTLDDGVVITSQNGSFFATGANSPALTLNAPVTRGGGILQLGDGSSTGNAVVRSAQIYSLAGGGSISGSNTTGTATTGTITINNGNNAEFSGGISEGGTGIIALTKSGAGTQSLSGPNAYTGKTTVSAGTLRFAKQVSLYNNTPASWTDTKIQVDSNAVLALNVGGSGEFTSSNIASLTALGTASGGFRSGSKLGLDTTNAGGSFSYGNVLANPNAGANALGLRKLGSGTLVLDQVNTFSGGTVVEGGTLKIVKPGGIHTSALVINSATTFDADFSALVAPGQITNTTTGTGTISATPPNASQLSFTSLTLTNFAGTINVKPSPASNGRVDFNGLIGSGSTLNIDSGATARLANSGTYSGLIINVSGSGGSGPGALRMENGTLDSLCAVNLLGDTAIGGFNTTAGEIITEVISTINAGIADGGNGHGLTKSGTSTLVLTATNTYSGDTNVNGGTLRISKPYLANASDIVIGAAAILDLNFDESGGAVSDTVSTLTIDGVQQAAGVYGATGSGAPVPNDTHFAGSGTLTVLNGPAPAGGFATWASANGIAGQPFDGDFDNDGLSNGVEYALGKSPTISSQPPGTLAGNILTFTKGADATASSDVSWVIETSTTLAAGSWTAEVTQAPGDAAATIGYTFTPGTPVKKFARLKVVQNP